MATGKGEGPNVRMIELSFDPPPFAGLPPIDFGTMEGFEPPPDDAQADPRYGWQTSEHWHDINGTVHTRFEVEAFCVRTVMLPCGKVFRSSIHRPTDRKKRYHTAVVRRHRRRCTGCRNAAIQGAANGRA